MLTGAQFIGSRRVPGEGAGFHGWNPATGQPLEPAFSQASTAQVTAAAAAAWEAFSTYRLLPAERRAAFLSAVADELTAVADELVARVMEETGIPAARVRGELTRTTGQLRLFADVVREGSWIMPRLETALPDRAPLPRPDLRQGRVPLGPVAVFGASNFPLAFSVAGGDTASAWAAGCPVVAKAHPSHPGTSEIVAGAIVRAVEREDMPPGVFSMVHGGPADVAVPLVQHPGIRAVGFTGSRSAGLALVRAAAQRPAPVPVYAEMSSVNPVILLPGALAERAAELGRAYVASLTTGQGQLCTSPGLVFAVDSDGLDAFVHSAAQAVSDTGEGTMLNPSICAAFDQGVARLRSTAGVTEVAAGTDGGSVAAGAVTALFETGLSTFQDDKTLAEEIFGAVSLVVRAGSSDDLVDAVARLDGQLTATIHHGPGDEELVVRLRETLELIAGRILFDGWPTGVEVGHAMVHGGPFPATSDGRTTSVGTLAIERFVRPVVYQAAPQDALPPVLRDGNPLGVWRQVDGILGRH